MTRRNFLAGAGGLAAMAERNRRKSAKLYEAIDSSTLYRNPVSPECRSWMNVPFTLADPALDKIFLDEAKAAGLANQYRWEITLIRDKTANASVLPNGKIIAIGAFDF